MALQDIIQKIQKDLEKDLAKIEKEEKEELREIDKEFVQSKKDLEKKKEKRVKEKAKGIEQKMATLLSMESRSKLLKEKIDLIEKVFQKAIDELCKFPDGEYKKVLAVLMKKLPEGEGEIVSVSGREKITEEALREAGKSGYTLGKASSAIKGGFIMKTGKIEIDNSFTTLVNQILKDEVETEVAGVLFS